MAIVQDEELLQMFIEESKDHMEGIEADFLDIEEMGAEIDSDLVNKVFRAIHSIKGGAGFLGLDTIKELSHSMENTLNLIRNSELIPTPEVISTLLSALDTLRDLIADFMGSNDVDISAHLSALKEVSNPQDEPAADESEKGEEKPSKSKKEKDKAAPAEDLPEAIVNIKLPSGQSIFSVPENDLVQAGKAGRILYLAKFDMLNDIERKNHTPLDVIKEIQDTGMLVESKVDIESVGTLDGLDAHVMVPFYVLFSTVLEPSIAPKLINLDAWKVYQLDENYQLSPLEKEPVSETPPPPPAPKEESKPKSKPKPKKQKTKKTEPKEEKVVEEIKTPQPVPEVVAESKVAAGSKASRPKISTKSTTLRVNVKLLDTLMNLAGELVLTRNQLLQNFSRTENSSMENAVQRVDLITSELQEAIMSTRMQPVGTVFNKFQRVVHDMSKDLNKQVELVIEGESVELDKTIIEAIGDPLTHLVRNSMDHGIEMPDVRAKAGKKLPATLKLSAFHEAGQVNIDVSDDGRGIDPLKIKSKILEKGMMDKAQVEAMSENELLRTIFQPGFSTAEKVTEVSGRGVGMDVVYSNLSRLGGSVDIESKVGMGTTIHIKLPLTLAIIPSLILEVQNARYAIPQVNLVELVRIPAAQVHERIEKIEEASLLRLRGELLPIIRVSDVLNIERVYKDKSTGQEKTDRRENIYDRRSADIAEIEFEGDEEELKERRKKDDRRKNKDSAFNIVVVNAGELNYGLIVDNLLDSEEIVVKPLGQHLRSINTYAGATILGDGHAALILDVMGLSSVMNLKVVKEKVQEAAVIKKLEKNKDAQSLLLVNNSEDEQFAIPLGLVSRIEKIKKTEIELTSGKQTVKYRGSSLLLCSIEDVANVKPREDTEQPFVIIFPFAGKEVGVLVSQIIDVIDASVEVDEETFRQPGVLGSAILMERTTLLLDLYGIISNIMPEWVAEQRAIQEEQADGTKGTLLIVEDSSFFLNQIKGFTQDAGYQVLTAMDGIEGAEAVENPDNKIDLVLTDIEMPNMDGVQMTERLRGQEHFQKLPIIALTSVAGDTAEQRALDAGIDEYLIKLDREKVLERVAYYLENGRPM